jgi:hypothetical protein
MSIAESVIPMQEYMTSAYRAELLLGLLQSTPRIGVKPDRVDFEEMADGEAAIFILDSKFDPAKDVYEMPIPNGNPTFLDNTISRMQQDQMAMVGMTSPQDVFNPEVMDPGNSGAKLNLALSPNQVIQDNTVKNCAEGLKEAIWLVWRTLVQYADDFGVKKLAAEFHPEGKPIFLDGEAFDDMNFNDRKTIHIDLALGMKSEENSLQRLQIIKQAQTGLAQEVQAGVAGGFLTPAGFKKMRKPYEDMLYVLGVKDCDVYLPTQDEVMDMVKQSQQHAQQAQQQPNPQMDHIKSQTAVNMAKVQESQAKTQQITADTQGNSAKMQLDGFSLVGEHKARAF